ncbi:hypothetical protein ACLOJK_008789 [Asimina triloba]
MVTLKSDSSSYEGAHSHVDMEAIPCGDPMFNPEEAPRATSKDYAVVNEETTPGDAVGVVGAVNVGSSDAGNIAKHRNAKEPREPQRVMMADVAPGGAADREVEARIDVEEARGVEIGSTIAKVVGFDVVGSGKNSSIREPQ